MVYHANNAWLHGGFLGVEVFFVISGYLITLLLIAEHERSGRIGLRQFWLRRARRLLPALFVMLAVLAVYMASCSRRPEGARRGDIVGGLSYVSNWYQIWVGAGLHRQRGVRPAAPPVVAGGGGAVLPDVAAGDGGVLLPRSGAG